METYNSHNKSQLNRLVSHDVDLCFPGYSEVCCAGVEDKVRWLCSVELQHHGHVGKLVIELKRGGEGGRENKCVGVVYRLACLRKKELEGGGVELNRKIFRDLSERGV